MTIDHRVDLRAAVNAVSDVIVNRPRPLRAFDQIYMKAGDMVAQAEIVASWADGKELAFIGDGDSISVCVAYMRRRKILSYGPARITVFDFDERIVNAIKRFAGKEGLDHLDAVLYNCLDPLPDVQRHEFFYTNPPWGASNNGESVHVFAQRGMEATGYAGEGMIVIADDQELAWSKQVLASTQAFAAKQGFYTCSMRPKVHEYHLDDAPELRSCNLVVAALPGTAPPPGGSQAINDPVRLTNFYGRGADPHVHFVREAKTLDYGKASEDEYFLQLIGGAP